MDRTLVLVAACALGVPNAAFAQGASGAGQAYPNKPIRVVVPWTPGQATDLAARLVAQKISEAVGQQLVVDNRAGAGGTIGSEAVARAVPDGYTILAGSAGPITISPLLQSVPYDSFKNFSPIALIATVPFVLVTNTAFPATNVKELIALVKANPGKYTFSSSGTGAGAHLVSELFNSTAQLQVTHVPYKGSAPSTIDVASGQVAYTFETVVAVVGHIKAGRLKPYAISSARRNATLPDVPPVAEAAGMPGFDMSAWIGYLAPAGTPRDMRVRLSVETQKALQAPDVRERYQALGMDPTSSTPEELGAIMKAEHARFDGIIKKANIKLE